MSINVRPSFALTRDLASNLEQRLTAYYRRPPSSYYLLSDRAADQYNSTAQPFHCDLVRRIQTGQSVVEVGCGSAHLCPQVEAAGGSYTGLDHSEELLMRNRSRFPKARFFSLGDQPTETFDVVASLYTIEHVIDPQLYLRQLWDLCHPGGLIGVICPDFVDGDGYPPSFYYGVTPRRLRVKIASLALKDALSHLVDLFIFAPRWKRRARAAPPGAFWINLAPRIFAGADYTIDADAVHLPRLTDMIWWMQERGAEIIDTSLTLASAAESVLKHNCYILARKPGIATSAGS